MYKELSPQISILPHKHQIKPSKKQNPRFPDDLRHLFFSVNRKLYYVLWKVNKNKVNKNKRQQLQYLQFGPIREINCMEKTFLEQVNAVMFTLFFFLSLCRFVKFYLVDKKVNFLLTVLY